MTMRSVSPDLVVGLFLKLTMFDRVDRWLIGQEFRIVYVCHLIRKLLRLAWPLGLSCLFLIFPIKA